MLGSRTKPPIPCLDTDAAFVAIDFETADYGADSACAVGMVRVEGGRVVRREVRLIRPPRTRVLFTHIHGITWRMVASVPAFAEAWAELAPMLEGASFLAAHNAPFDRKVLAACCYATGHAFPQAPFVCTVQLARRTWDIRPTRLPDVCRRLGIGLTHHEAGSDAEACARIVIAARASRASTPQEVGPSLGIEADGAARVGPGGAGPGCRLVGG